MFGNPGPTKIRRAILDLEFSIRRLTGELAPLEKDERHPLSRDFPSRACREGDVASRRRELEQLQDDLAILREVHDGKIDLQEEEFLRREIPNIREARDNLVKTDIELCAKLSAIERVKTLLRS